MTTRKGSRNWYFKRPVPAALQDAFGGKKQIWISLRTPDKAEAMQIYYSVADDVECQLEAARLGSPTGTEYNIAKRARLKRYQAAKNDAFAYAAETG
ncbi:MAG: hypothetical protein L3J67_04300, partial [Hyphomicrobiaceae bacterium]|nr:hypothetical protein [Hyphomicrobiaceae bacterium]